MARELVRCARENGWESIEATANDDSDILYAHTDQAGRSFWEKIGLRVVKMEDASRFHGDFLDKMLQQAREQGLGPEKVQFRYTTRLDLTESLLSAPFASDLCPACIASQRTPLLGSRR